MSDTPTIPQTMAAVEYTTYGPPASVLTLSSTHAVPTPSANDVLIRIHAAAMNGIDHKMTKGELQLIFRRQLPIIPGMDISGVVVAVGSACSRIKVGDEVYAASFNKCGAFAEFAVVEESGVALKPPHLTFLEAASLPACTTTSYNALLKAKLSSGQKIVILGASGGTGSFAIQMAKRVFGASHVAVTCSQRNADYVRSLGADTVIDYSTQSYGTVLAGQNYDVVYDCVGGAQNFEDSKSVLKSGGIYISLVGNDTGVITIISVLSMISTILIRTINAKIYSTPNYIYFTLDVSTSSSDLEKITVMFNKGQIKIDGIIEKVYSFTLKDIQEMFATNEKGHVRGKLALQIISTANQK